MTLEKLKNRMGIDNVSIYDAELTDLMEAAKADILAAGVPSSLVEDEDERVDIAITAFVKANFADDRTNTTRYLSMYREMVFRLTLEEGGT